MDVREVSRKVKEYFKEVKDTEPLAFDIDNATFDNKTKVWIIECSFYKNPLETKRVQYTLLVDDQTGGIRELKTTNGKNGSSS